MKDRKQKKAARVFYATMALFVFLTIDAEMGFAVNAELNLAASTTLTLEGGASVDISGDVVNAGTMTLTNGSLTLTGSLNSSVGSFTQSAGTVTFNDNTQTSVISGSHTFYNLTSATSNKTLQFQTGTTQTVNNVLTLTGGGVLSTQTIKLQCNGGAGAGCWNLSVSAAAHSVSYVAVQDSEVLGNDLTADSSTNSGNNDDAAASPHWVFSPHATGTVTDTATSIADSGSDDALKITVQNKLNDASAEIRVDEIKVKFMDAAGTALTTTEAQNLFSAVRVYHDDNASGTYEPATDTTLVAEDLSAALSLTAGYQTIVRDIAATDASVLMMGFNTSDTYFVVPVLSASATSQAKNAFKVYHKPAATSDLTLYNTYTAAAVTNISGTAVTSKTAKAAYWIFTLSATPIYAAPVLRNIGGTNKIFVGSGDDVTETDGKLYRLDLTTGATDWSYPAAGNTAGIRVIPSAFKDPVSLITYIYFGTENGKLYSVDETGAQRFAPVTVGGIGSALRSSPSLRGYISAWCATCIGVFAADGSANASIWAYRADTGAFQWQSAATGTTILGHPFVNNNEIYIGAENGTIYEFATADGSTLSSNGTSCSGNQARGVGFSASSKLWTGCTNGSLYEFGTADLTTPNWSFASGSAIESGVSWRFNKLYFGNNAGTLFSRNDNNTPNWSYTSAAGGAIKSIPLATSTAVYYTADDGYLYKLTSAGALSSNFPASLGTGTVTVSPVAAIGGSRIVVSVTEGTTGKVFCFPDN